MTIFAARGGLQFSAAIDRNELHPVADTEHRRVNTRIEILGQSRCAFVGNTRRPAREDHALRLFGDDIVDRDIERMDLAINALLTDTPRDQLRILRTEIENEDKFVVQRKLHW